MKTKISKPLPQLPPNTPPIITVYFEFTHLKQLFRQGWIYHHIPEECCESVAEHSFGVAAIGLFLAETYFPEMDLLKILRMSLIHDFGEIYAGDFIPEDNISPEEKHQLEKESVTRIFRNIPNGNVYQDLWEEFESGHTPEAHFVRQIDKLEMALQASVYEHQDFGNLLAFYQSASKAIVDPKLIAIMDELQRLRDTSKFTNQSSV